MRRRSFIGRCAVLGAALGLASREVLGDYKKSSRPAKSSNNSSASNMKVVDGNPDNALTYLGSFATPTLTDTYVKPNKTAKINFGKHTKMAYCPDNGGIYICGGDGRGQHWGGNDSGTMDTVGRYDVERHAYREDFLYRGYAGEPIPRGLDYIAFTWSPSHKEFWLGPGYSWNYANQYPWVETTWRTSNYASYNPVTRRFTDRGARTSGAFNEGFAGSWDTKRNRLVWASGQRFWSMNPATNELTFVDINVSSHPIQSSNTMYDEKLDELYFAQTTIGLVYGYTIGTNKLRLIADLGVKTEATFTAANVWIPDGFVLIVYREDVAGPLPWKLVNLKTGEKTEFNLFAPGCDYYNTGCYHPPTKTIVLTGGNINGNFNNGGAFHHYRSNL